MAKTKQFEVISTEHKKYSFKLTFIDKDIEKTDIEKTEDIVFDLISNRKIRHFELEKNIELFEERLSEFVNKVELIIK